MAHHTRLTRRLGALVAVAAASLFGATQAFGAITPHLLVTATSSGSTHSLNITTSRAQTDDPAARVQIDVPSGYKVALPAAGSKLGTATAQVVARDIDPTTEQGMTGTVTAVSPTDLSVAYDSASCDNRTHLAAWTVALNGTNGQLNVPIFVDQTTGTDATYGQYELVLCYRPVVAATAQNGSNRSPSGDVVDTLDLSLTPFTSPTKTGAYRWRSLWTPYAMDPSNPQGTALTMNTAGNAEAQSIVSVPSGAVSIAAKTKTIHVKGKLRLVVTITGKLEVGGEPKTGTAVSIRTGKSSKRLSGVAKVRTTKTGSYVKTLTLTKPVYVQASAALGLQDLGAGGCTASFGAAVPCVDATVGGSTALSRILHVK
jgi:hypothetical protein